MIVETSLSVHMFVKEYVGCMVHIAKGRCLLHYFLSLPSTS